MVTVFVIDGFDTNEIIMELPPVGKPANFENIMSVEDADGGVTNCTVSFIFIRSTTVPNAYVSPLNT